MEDSLPQADDDWPSTQEVMLAYFTQRMKNDLSTAPFKLTSALIVMHAGCEVDLERLSPYADKLLSFNFDKNKIHNSHQIDSEMLLKDLKESADEYLHGYLQDDKLDWHLIASILNEASKVIYESVQHKLFKRIRLVLKWCLDYFYSPCPDSESSLEEQIMEYGGWSDLINDTSLDYLLLSSSEDKQNSWDYVSNKIVSLVAPMDETSSNSIGVEKSEGASDKESLSWGEEDSLSKFDPTDRNEIFRGVLDDVNLSWGPIDKNTIFGWDEIYGVKGYFIEDEYGFRIIPGRLAIQSRDKNKPQPIVTNSMGLESTNSSSLKDCCARAKRRDERCLICQHFICTVHGCQFDSKMRSHIRIHYLNTHAKHNQQINMCNCEVLKIRSRQNSAGCQKCNRFWCLVEQCSFTSTRRKSLVIHFEIFHPHNRLCFSLIPKMSKMDNPIEDAAHAEDIEPKLTSHKGIEPEPMLPKEIEPAPALPMNISYFSLEKCDCGSSRAQSGRCLICGTFACSVCNLKFDVLEIKLRYTGIRPDQRTIAAQADCTCGGNRDVNLRCLKCNTFGCPACEKTYLRYDALENHYRRWHGEYKRPPSDYFSVIECSCGGGRTKIGCCLKCHTYACSKCSYKNSKKHGVSRHFQRFHGDNLRAHFESTHCFLQPKVFGRMSLNHLSQLSRKPCVCGGSRGDNLRCLKCKMVACLECERRFREIFHVKLHYDSVHIKDTDYKLPDDYLSMKDCSCGGHRRASGRCPKGCNYSCSLCSFVHQRRRGLSIHFREEHKDEMIPITKANNNA